MVTIKELFIRMVDRSPDKRDCELIDKLAITLPDELKNDIGMKAELVLRAAHIRQLEEVMNEAANVVRRKVEIDGEKWAMDAANRVWRRVEAQLPPSASTKVFWTLIAITFWSALLGAVFYNMGWNSSEETYETASESLQALTETEFAFCVVNAAQHASQIRSGKGPGDAAKALRASTRNCAAEYDQRRVALQQ
ncbi:hypothetical protein K3165_08380 [Qipengyuania sp. 1XM1-15A]|uniref:hypothetical protein n=1 Tax=Qipengyuania xiamenensis TaxID=2867237 RepID=UPI001C875512|nr:hypothetical protein [Qipengyuania xiamenensis]MBX7532934.1 hypothetical protein [Qipengyuania xiamenensis]